MRNILTIFLTSIMCNISVAQLNENVKIKWKIQDDEVIVYQTLMNEIDTNTIEFNFGGLFDMIHDSISSEAQDMFNKMQESFKEIDLVTTLSSKGDAVKIEMKTVDQEKVKKKKSKKDEEIDFQKLMMSLNDGVVLRGSVYKSGGIESFWVKSNQKNLISIFFELPKGEVKVGDSWKLDVSLIGNDQNFDCDSSFHKNEVTLIDIKVTEDDTIAILKYDIQEFVTGDFNTPFSDEPTITTMLMTHEAVGEFSITKGRWNAYNGIMTFIASGIMTSNTRKSFSLVTID